MISGESLLSVRSASDWDSTNAHLQEAIAKRGHTLFARIDHAAEAQRAGLKLRPTVVYVFGNPKGGTQFMEAAPTMGLDLPLKVLVWQDGHGVHLTRYQFAELAKRHDLQGKEEAVNALDAMLETLVAEAAR